MYSTEPPPLSSSPRSLSLLLPLRLRKSSPVLRYGQPSFVLETLAQLWPVAEEEEDLEPHEEDLRE